MLGARLQAAAAKTYVEEGLFFLLSESPVLHLALLHCFPPQLLQRGVPTIDKLFAQAEPYLKETAPYLKKMEPHVKVQPTVLQDR